ncbi:MAG TPA: copper chaperone PCu(A)C [Marmoricola sp.]|nr:copper chaperone PCu(A)C [Marmoricola sp.]
MGGAVVVGHGWRRGPGGRGARALAGGGALALAVALAGCGGPPVKKISEGPGQSAKTGTIDVAGLQLAAAPDGVWPAGAHVPLIGRLVNEGAEPDFLLDVSSPAAASGHVIPAHAQRPGIMLAPGEPVKVGQPAPVAILDGLHQPLRDGDLVEVTLTFTKAEPVHARLHVRVPKASASASPTSSSSASSSASASATSSSGSTG